MEGGVGGGGAGRGGVDNPRQFNMRFCTRSVLWRAALLVRSPARAPIQPRLAVWAGAWPRE
eukprot:4127106-Pyramimonas_sp.AAC.1